MNKRRRMPADERQQMHSENPERGRTKRLRTDSLREVVQCNTVARHTVASRTGATAQGYSRKRLRLAAGGM